MTKISDDELSRLAQGYPPEESEPTIMSMAAELKQLRESRDRLRGVSEGIDTLEAHANSIRRDKPITARRITDIIDAYRAAFA